MRHLATDPTLNQPVENPEPPRDTTDWEDCTPLGDRGVLKRVIRSGNADAGVPIDGWCAKVNYDAYIEGGWFHGRKVDTTRDRADEDGDYQFLVGDTHEAVTGGWVIKGLNYGCLNMHRGERAELVIAPEYAYGAKGNRSRPKIPPNATLRIVVDMLTWSPALSDEKSMLEMPWWERLELAHATKDSANEHFREGQPEEARARYWKAGMLMDVLGSAGTDIQMPSDRIEEQNALAHLLAERGHVLHTDGAERGGDWHELQGAADGLVDSPTLWRKAIASCDAAFKLDPDNVKDTTARLRLRTCTSSTRARHLERARAGNPSSRRSAARWTDCASIERARRSKIGGCSSGAGSAGLYSERPDPVAIAEEPVHTSAGSTAPAASAAASTAASTGSSVGAASSAEMLLVKPRVWLALSIDGKAIGRVVLELWSDRMPKTAENFRQLCTGEGGLHVLSRRPLHYKGTPIHRIVRGTCIQGGDITRGDGVGGESIYGGFFADEGFEAKHGEPGLLGMANQGRDTNRSQFYITTSACPHLDGRHVVFGKVLEGMDHVRKVEALQTASGSERPSVVVSISDCGELQQSVPVR